MQRRDMLIQAATAALILAAVLPGCARAQGGGAEALLEGLIFVGHTGPIDGSAVDGEDEVLFRNGRFLSTACNTWGFDSAAYTAESTADGIRFQAVTTSPKHGRIHWQGVVTGDRMQATYLWTKARWYWFDAREERRFEGRIKRE